MPVQIKRGGALATLSLTPLIDVVFLLLIFFLVTARFAEEDYEMELPLPDASEAMPITVAPREVNVNIDGDGRFIVDGQTLSENELEGLLRRAAANNPGNQTVQIRADRDVPFQYVVTAGNLCKRVGIHDFHFSTSGPGQ